MTDLIIDFEVMKILYSFQDEMADMKRRLAIIDRKFQEFDLETEKMKAAETNKAVDPFIHDCIKFF